MSAILAQLNHLLACLNEGSPDPVGAREQDTVAILAPHAPLSDRDLDTRKSRPQSLTEITCLRQSAGGYGCDNNQRRSFFANKGNNFGGEHCVGHDLDIISGGIKQMAKHVESEFIRFV